MSECYRKPWLTSFIHLLLEGNPDDPEYVHVSSSRCYLYCLTVQRFSERRLFQVEVPDELVALQYGDCVRKFLDMVRFSPFT